MARPGRRRRGAGAVRRRLVRGRICRTVGLVLFAPLLVRVALLFGPAEYFALYRSRSRRSAGSPEPNQAKAALAAGLGLGIAMIGVDP